MEKKKEVKYLPFHAINEFMRDDYRITLLQEVLGDQNSIPAEIKQRIGRMISKGVKIPGFRNSNLAPAAIKVKNSIHLFEQSPEFVSSLIEAWSYLHSDLKENMAGVLKLRGWKIPAPDSDHSQLPGFQIDWPKSDTFEILIEELQKIASDLNESSDNISLMAVWLGNRLPYNLYDVEEKAD